MAYLENCLMRFIEGQGATAGPSCYILARRLLIGCALAKFNSAAMVRMTETREHYLQCLQEVTASKFPQDSLKEQKTWMRRFLKKPADWNIKKYVARVVEINEYLVQFPPKTIIRNSNKIPEDKLLELLNFGIPLKWRNHLHLQNYKV